MWKGDLLKIVIPGEMVWDTPKSVPHTYVEGGKTYAKVVGLMRDDRFVPLQVSYKPKVGDAVVGIVVDERGPGYMVDVNLPYNAVIPTRKVRIKLPISAAVFGKITFVDEVGNTDIGYVKELSRGKLVTVPASKVPRIIGKKSSMLEQIKKETGSALFVGNNGYIWIVGGDMPLAIRAIDRIILKATTNGLTDDMAEWLHEEKTKKVK